MAALRAAVRYSREGMGGIQVVGRTEAGVERRSLSRTPDGVLEYLFPAIDAYSGPQDAVAAALARWDGTLGDWAGDASDPDATNSTSSATSTTSNGNNGAPTAAEIAAAIQSSLMEMTVDINLNEVESLIRRTIESTFGEFAATARPSPSASITPVRTGPDPDQLADRIGARVVERIKPLLAAAGRPSVGMVPAKGPAIDDRAAEQIAAMVAYQIDSFLEALSPDGIGPVEALRQIEPVLSDIEVTQKQLLAQAASQVGFESRIGGAMEHLDLQVQELREHTRTAATALQLLTEQVAPLSRRSEAANERLANAMGQELDQFGDRFKHQLVNVESAAKRTARDMPVPDAVTRLSARLARSEAQLEQLLRQLTQMMPPVPGPLPARRLRRAARVPEPRRPTPQPRRPTPEPSGTAEPRPDGRAIPHAGPPPSAGPPPEAGGAPARPTPPTPEPRPTPGEPATPEPRPTPARRRPTPARSRR